MSRWYPGGFQASLPAKGHGTYGYGLTGGPVRLQSMKLPRAAMQRAGGQTGQARGSEGAAEEVSQAGACAPSSV